MGTARWLTPAAPLFSLFWDDSQWYLADVAHNVLDRLVTEKRVTLDAPACVELNVTEKEGHIVAHLINYQLHKEDVPRPANRAGLQSGAELSPPA